MVGETIPLDINPASRDRVGITRRFPIGPIAGHQPVQLPAQPRGPQGRAGDRLGQPDRAQAAVQGPAGHAQGRGDHRGGRAARRRGEHPADEPRAGRPDGRGRAVQAAQLHRVAVRRLADEGPGRQEEGRARAGRQRRRDRRQVGGPGLGRPADRDRRVHLQRPGVHQRPAAVRARGRLGRVHAPVRRGDAQPPPGRPVGRVDGRRARWSTRRTPRGPSRGSTRRSRPAPRCCRRDARGHVLRPDDPRRRAAHGEGLHQRGVRADRGGGALLVAARRRSRPSTTPRSGSRPACSRPTSARRGRASTSSRWAA